MLQNSRWSGYVLFCALCLAAGTALGQVGPPPAPAQPGAEAEPERATLVIENQPIFEFRSVFYGTSPQDRAQGAYVRIMALVDKQAEGKVESKEIPQGMMITVDGQLVFVIALADVDQAEGDALSKVAETVVVNLTLAFEAAKEQRSLTYLLWATVLSALATIALFLIVLTLIRGDRWISTRLHDAASRHTEKLKIGGVVPLNVEYIWLAVQRIISFAFWALGLFVGYAWLTFCLRRFPYSRPWGEHMRSYMLPALGSFAAAVVSAAPGLLVVIVIFIVTRFFVRLVKVFFSKFEEGQISAGWLDADTAGPTRRLVVVVLWLFALAMAYPYIPGSDSSAFKGVSVFVGLMVSIGASGLVGQGFSGLILTYSRALKPGEYVKIGETEGTVASVGMFSTKIMTNKREEVNIPNSIIVSSQTKNYSRLAKDGGVILYTSVTIGYSTPWRQVHEMLKLAADRTPGLSKEPLPFVYQTSLSDFYVEYQLNAHLEKPEQRGRVLAALHANIQDVFNEYGVQIMSPHYEADPAEKAWVPKEKWFEPPAQKT